MIQAKEAKTSQIQDVEKIGPSPTIQQYPVYGPKALIPIPKEGSALACALGKTVKVQKKIIVATKGHEALDSENNSRCRWYSWCCRCIGICRLVTFLLNFSHIYVAGLFARGYYRIETYYNLMGANIFQSGLIWVLIFTLRNILSFLLGFVATCNNMKAIIKIYAYECLAWTLVLILIYKTAPIEPYFSFRYLGALKTSQTHYHYRNWTREEITSLSRDLSIDMNSALVRDTHIFWDTIQTKYECCGTSGDDLRGWPQTMPITCAPDINMSVLDRTSCDHVLTHFARSIKVEIVFYIVLNFLLFVCGLCAASSEDPDYGPVNSLEAPGSIISHRKICDKIKSSRPMPGAEEILMRLIPKNSQSGPPVDFSSNQSYEATQKTIPFARVPQLGPDQASAGNSTRIVKTASKNFGQAGSKNTKTLAAVKQFISGKS